MVHDWCVRVARAAGQAKVIVAASGLLAVTRELLPTAAAIGCLLLRGCDRSRGRRICCRRLLQVMLQFCPLLLVQAGARGHRAQLKQAVDYLMEQPARRVAS